MNKLFRVLKNFLEEKAYTRLSRNIFVSFDSKLSFVLKNIKIFMNRMNSIGLPLEKENSIY